ncbi:16S rRNA (guanine(966)-N(2))-methyltransferase RsmD [Microlunatus parietis]|uniref:16S rRNA (Guanine966-N2)-methyltransferase n=1 Tax=Microlunatus parietis TaxID=682979 RepID=A0A7Y9LF13_9ACTN|nr:16S rRNA (guanine(966)-N(2))-methyltransferase RsmD [Microlunatus parietis]NYE74383.1 16S rRNA (guanine966-N2)-methyltransferase [Microlunatus parietis]
MSRIVAGRYGGRRLKHPVGDRTRPTTDRAREALFAMLASWAGAGGDAGESLAGLSFLDLYAGSGAVGLEAASRGADPVLMVEADQRTVRGVIRSNIASLGARAAVRAGRVEQVVKGPAPLAYDLVFVDPPYELGSPDLSAVLADLVGHGWVADDGLIVVERSRRSPELTPPSPYTEVGTRRYGETVLSTFSRPVA